MKWYLLKAWFVFLVQSSFGGDTWHSLTFLRMVVALQTVTVAGGPEVQAGRAQACPPFLPYAAPSVSFDIQVIILPRFHCLITVINLFNFDIIDDKSSVLVLHLQW